MYPRVLQQVQQGNIKHLCILSESRSQNNVYIWMNERKTNFTIFLIDMHLRQLPIQPWTFYFHALLVSRQYTSTDSIRLQMSTDSTSSKCLLIQQSSKCLHMKLQKKNQQSEKRQITKMYTVTNHENIYRHNCKDFYSAWTK